MVVELIAGILIGGTVMTVLWIMDLKHVHKRNEETSWEEWNRAWTLTREREQS